MARKTATITIPDVPTGNRDAGKTFLITEMPAMAAERWGTRALLALSRSDYQVPDLDPDAGFAELVRIGIELLCRVEYAEVEPLLNEMLQCVQFVPDPRNPDIPPHPHVEQVVEEVATLLMLRREVWDIHSGFSYAGVMSILTSATSRAA